MLVKQLLLCTAVVLKGNLFELFVYGYFHSYIVVSITSYDCLS